MGNECTNKKSKIETDYLSEDQIESLLKETNFSREEILEFFQQFQKICPNGELNKKEFVEFFARLRPDKDADLLSEQFFNAFDADHSGKVDFYEFLTAISLTSNKDPKKKLEFVFKMYDLNRDQKLNAKELEKIILGIYEFNMQKDRTGHNDPKYIAKSLLKKYDRDSSGYLTVDELMGGVITDNTLAAIDAFMLLKDANFKRPTLSD